MILPEDTKPPLPSDDEGDGGALSPGLAPPPPLPPGAAAGEPLLPLALAEAYTDRIDDDDYAPPYPSPPAGAAAYPYADSPPASPRSHATLPLLAGAGDIRLTDLAELGPAPPYSAHDPSARAPRAGKPATLLDRARRRSRTLAAAAALYLLVTLATVASTRHYARARQPPPHPGGQGQGDGQHRGAPRPDGGDGAAVACAAFSPAVFAPFPAAAGLPHLPAPPADGRTRRSANATFALDAARADVWARLVGPAGVGDVFFSTYEPGAPLPEGTISYDGDGDDAAADGAHGHRPERGRSDVRVTVEAIIDVVPGVPDDTPADADNSPGWEALDLSSVCLMRCANGSSDAAAAAAAGPAPRLGVGVYTSLPESPRHPAYSDALRFRLHVALPRADPQPAGLAALAAALADAFAGPAPPPPPPGAVRSLAVYGGVSSFWIPALDGTALGRLELTSQVGGMELDVRAESVRLATLGDVRGRVAVSDRLEVTTPAGEIDLDLHITAPCRDNDPGPPPPANGTASGPPPPRDADSAACRGRPAEIMIAANNDQATVRHVGWDEPCRGVNVLLRNIVGSSEFHPHPLYEGPFRLSTSIGEIRVDNADADVVDPTGSGRWRNVTLHKHDRVTSRNWMGEVQWESGARGARGAGVDDAGAAAALGRRGHNVDALALPPPPLSGVAAAEVEERERGPRPFPPKLERGIVIETQVGSIGLVL